MSPDPARRENNTNTISGGSVTNSAIVAGSEAKVRVSVGPAPENPEVATAIEDLRRALTETRATVDRHDDETEDSLVLAERRLAALEKEMQAPKAKRDWGRVTKLLTDIRDAVAGATALTVSADALSRAIEQVIR